MILKPTVTVPSIGEVAGGLTFASAVTRTGYITMGIRRHKIMASYGGHGEASGIL